MYEHVGMADNHHRRRSDAWQITSLLDHYHNNKEQRMMNDIEDVQRLRQRRQATLMTDP
jgi:hypothetical protein